MSSRSLKRQRIEMEDDWGDDDDEMCFSQDVLNKFDEICSQSQGVPSRPPIATSTPRQDSGFGPSQPKIPFNSNRTSASSTAIKASSNRPSTLQQQQQDPFRQPAPPQPQPLTGNGDGRRNPPPTAASGEREKFLKREIEKLQNELKEENGAKLRHAGEAANLRTAQDNHKREVDKIRSELDKRREDQLGAEREKTLDALKMMEKLKKERNQLETQLSFKSREVADANQQMETLTKLVEDQKIEGSTAHLPVLANGPSPKRVKLSTNIRDSSSVAASSSSSRAAATSSTTASSTMMDKSGFPLSQMEFCAMPTATANGFIKGVGGKKGVHMKEAECQTTETVRGIKGKERRSRALVKRSDGASNGFAGSRCVDHLLSTLKSQESIFTDLLEKRRGFTFDNRSISSNQMSNWLELLEGLRELLRAKNIKDGAESEALIYVGLPLMTYLETVLSSCVSFLDARKKSVAESHFDRLYLPKMFLIATTSFEQLTILLHYSPTTFRDDLLTKMAPSQKDQSSNPSKSPRPILSSVVNILEHFASFCSSISSPSTPSSSIPFVRLLVPAFSSIRALALSCDATSYAPVNNNNNNISSSVSVYNKDINVVTSPSLLTLFSPLLRARPDLSSPIHAAFSALIDIRTSCQKAKAKQDELSRRDRKRNPSSSSSSSTKSQQPFDECEDSVSSAILSCGKCMASVVFDKDAYTMACSESEECFWTVCFETLASYTVASAKIDDDDEDVDIPGSAIGSTIFKNKRFSTTKKISSKLKDCSSTDLDHSTPSIAEANRVVAAASCLFDIAFALGSPTPNPRVSPPAAAKPSTGCLTTCSTSSSAAAADPRSSASSSAPAPAIPLTTSVDANIPVKNNDIPASSARFQLNLKASSCPCLQSLVKSVLSSLHNLVETIDAVRYGPGPTDDTLVMNGMRTSLKGCRCLLQLRRNRSFAALAVENRMMRFVLSHFIPILQEKAAILGVSPEEISRLEKSLRPKEPTKVDPGDSGEPVIINMDMT